MLCQNCGKNEVNFRYTQIVNGVKKEMLLCDKCAKSLGLEGMDFNMPIDFSSFLGDFLNIASDTEFLPSFNKVENLRCDNCGMTYDEFVNSGKLGCHNCYDIFSETLNPVLKNIHGSASHIGRRSKLTNKDKKSVLNDINKQEQSKKQTEGNKKEDSKIQKIEKLNIELKQAIKDERYEDAAKIRDEIKKMAD